MEVDDGTVQVFWLNQYLEYFLGSTSTWDRTSLRRNFRRTRGKIYRFVKLFSRLKLIKILSKESSRVALIKFIHGFSLFLTQFRRSPHLHSNNCFFAFVIVIRRPLTHRERKKSKKKRSVGSISDSWDFVGWRRREEQKKFFNFHDINKLVKRVTKTNRVRR